MSAAAQTQSVDPARLQSGRWCHRADKTIGEGDIHASYSADRIGMGKKLRKPFSWKGGLWVCVGIAGRRGEVSAEAYRLVHPQIFNGEPVTYGVKTANGEGAALIRMASIMACWSSTQRKKRCCAGRRCSLCPDKPSNLRYFEKREEKMGFRLK